MHLRGDLQLRVVTLPKFLEKLFFKNISVMITLEVILAVGW